MTTWRNRSSRHQFRVRIIYHVIQTLDSAAKSFVSRLLLLFLLFDNMVEGKNGEMAKLQYIFKHGMTEYPKMRNGMSCCMNVEKTGTVKFLSQLL